MRTALCLLLLTPFVAAQREEADVEWQKRHARIEYGVVGVGRHKLDELQVGTPWRMGRNEASTLVTEMALVVGDRILVPGSYRVQVARQGDQEFALQIDGGTLGDAPQGTPGSIHAKADVAKPEKPTRNLEITFKPNGKPSGPMQAAKVTVTYGENRIVAGLDLVGTKSQKGGGFTLDAFTLPGEIVDERLTAGKLTPVLALKKETGKKKDPFHVWNLVVGKDGAELWPAPSAPTENNGFGDVKSLDGAAMVKATSVKWEDAKDAKPALEVTRFEAKAKVLTIVIAAGKQTCTITLPEPKIPS